MLHKSWKWVCRAVGPKLVVFLEHLTYHQNVASKSVLTRITYNLRDFLSRVHRYLLPLGSFYSAFL